MFNIFEYTAKAITSLRRNLAYNKASEELLSLTDKELADLGIYRGEVHNVVLSTLKQRIPSRSF